VPSEDAVDEVEVKHRTLSKEVLLGDIETNAKPGIQIKGKAKIRGSDLLEWRFSSSLGSMNTLPEGS